MENLQFIFIVLEKAGLLNPNCFVVMNNKQSLLLKKYLPHSNRSVCTERHSSLPFDPGCPVVLFQRSIVRLRSLFSLCMIRCSLLSGSLSSSSVLFNVLCWSVIVCEYSVFFVLYIPPIFTADQTRKSSSGEIEPKWCSNLPQCTAAAPKWAWVWILFKPEFYFFKLFFSQNCGYKSCLYIFPRSLNLI